MLCRVLKQWKIHLFLWGNNYIYCVYLDINGYRLVQFVMHNQRIDSGWFKPLEKQSDLGGKKAVWLDYLWMRGREFVNDRGNFKMKGGGRKEKWWTKPVKLLSSLFLQCIQLSELMRLSHINPDCWKDWAKWGISGVACIAEFGTCRLPMMAWCYHLKLFPDLIAAGFYFFCGMCKLSLQLKRYIEEKFFFNTRKHLWQLTKTYKIQQVLSIFGIYLFVRSFWKFCLCVNRRRSDTLRDNFYFSKFLSFSLLSPYELLKCICHFPKNDFNSLQELPPANCDQVLCLILWFLPSLLSLFFFPCFFLVFFCCVIFIYQLNSLPHKLFLQLVLSVSR